MGVTGPRHDPSSERKPIRCRRSKPSATVAGVGRLIGRIPPAVERTQVDRRPDGLAGGGGYGSVPQAVIFWLDLTVAINARCQGPDPNFLAHHSHPFDGVDDRQMAAALTMAAETAEEEYMQYPVASTPTTFQGCPARLQRQGTLHCPTADGRERGRRSLRYPLLNWSGQREPCRRVSCCGGFRKGRVR
ncbi:DUF2326 domain-containing protein [Streptomyces sp. NPDC001848]|uniref:DUF2326 domain-containing protein n=1 Tax=Streptomyces sp. NPDC001848 TaxID=3364618 RepID=UPI0036BBA1F2